MADSDAAVKPYLQDRYDRINTRIRKALSSAAAQRPTEEVPVNRQDKIDSLAEAMNRATPGNREEPVAASVLRALEGMGWTLLPKFMESGRDNA